MINLRCKFLNLNFFANFWPKSEWYVSFLLKILCSFSTFVFFSCVQITVFGLILTPVPQFLFCGLSQKAKEERIQSFSFSYLLLSLINNLIWLAYADKVEDPNIGIPSIVGALIAGILVVLYLSVRYSKMQVISVLALLFVSQMFFSSLIPTFITGSVASFISISTYFSTLGQIPAVIREKDSRYISLPIVTISLLNSTIWAIYSFIRGDIPFLLTQTLALVFMSINMIFYLWANDVIPKDQITHLITLFEIAFPDQD